jgi:hypothetical protein
MSLLAQTANIEQIGQVGGLVTSLGASGLAALTAWFLSNKHEKAVNDLTSKHVAAFTAIADSYTKLAANIEKRSDMYQDLERQRIVLMTQMAAALAACERRLDVLTSAMQASGHMDKDDGK